MSTTNAIWASLLLACLAYEMYALFDRRQGNTLSERTREWFRVNTRTGRVVFAVAWVVFAVWFFFHIL